MFKRFCAFFTSKTYSKILLTDVISVAALKQQSTVFLNRKESVSVYSDTGKEIHTGVFPEQKIISGLSLALKILNDDTINHLVSAAVFHYLFAYIHPFYNGNGRTGRFISSYYIAKYLNPLVAYRLSYIIKKHKSQYYKMFTETNDTRNMGDLTPFILQFSEFVLEVEKELCEEIENRVCKMEYYLEKIESISLSGIERNIAYYLVLNALFDNEGLSVSHLKKNTRNSYNTIKKAIEKLNEKKMIRSETSGKAILYEIDLDKLK